MAVSKNERDPKRSALLVSPVFQAMSEPELDEVLRMATEKSYRKGTQIFQKGDEGSSMMAVLKGRVQISSVSAEGREVTLNRINPGEIFGEIALLDGKPRSAGATAMEDTDLLIVERRVLLPFLSRNEDLFLRMLAVMCQRLRQTSLALEELALFDLPARLARVLLKLADDHGQPVAKGVRIGIRISHEHLGTIVASRRESVAKQISKWRKDGIIGKDNYYLVLQRPDELRALLD